MKLVLDNGDAYELKEIATSTFLVYQDRKFPEILCFPYEGLFGDASGNIYKSLIFNGKFYSYNLIKPDDGINRY